MKRILLASAAIVALGAAGGAWADQQAISEVTLQATSPNVCNITQPADPGVADVNFTAGAGFDLTLDLTNLIDTDTANISTTQIVLTYPGYCNYVHNFSIASLNTGIQGPAPVTGFDNVIHYVATAEWSARTNTATFNTAAPASSDSVIGEPANPSGFEVTLDVAANTSPLLAGAYLDTLTVTIGTTP